MPGPTDGIDIRPADAAEPAVAELISAHFQLMRSQSPAESCHVLPADGLSEPDISLFAAYDGQQLLGIGALKACDGYQELKSMHTESRARGRGVARKLLRFLMNEARVAGATRIFLETGAQQEHAPARRLYQSAGFQICPPFGSYVEDPLSVFMMCDI